MGVVTTVDVPEGVPSSATRDGAEADERRTKCNWVPNGERESRVAEDLIKANVERVFGEC